MASPLDRFSFGRLGSKVLPRLSHWLGRPSTLHWLVPFVFVALAGLMMPINDAFQFDPDEGFQIAKALACNDGYHLYSEIWNDQPPLHTCLLALWIDVFGVSIMTARLLTLIFAALLVWAFSQTLKLTMGIGPALAGTCLLVISINFLRLSVSVMIGLPALALAMTAVYWATRWHQRPRDYLAGISGGFLALALQTKLFTALLIPVIALMFWEKALPRKGPRSNRNAWRACGIYLLVLATSYLLIGLGLGSLDLNAFWQFHINDSPLPFGHWESIRHVLHMFLQDLDYLLLAMVGLRYRLHGHLTLPRTPLLWLVLASVVLLSHSPVWYHHYLLLSLPLAWLAAFGIAGARQVIENQRSAFPKQRRGLPGTAKACLILTMVLIPVKLTITMVENRAALSRSKDHRAVMASVMAYQDRTTWLFTDLPIYGGYANLKIPPELAVFSGKRMAAGRLSPEYLTMLLDTYCPEQFVLGRFSYLNEMLNPYLERHCVEVLQQGSIRHYVRQRLAAAPG